MSRAQREALTALLRHGPSMKPASVEALREQFAALMATMPVPDEVTITATTLGQRPALLVEPDGNRTEGTILYWHGGAFVAGSPRDCLGVTANLAVKTARRVLSLDYRLAPEHPFPAAVEDGLAAYRELLDRGTDPVSIVFAGDSSGGGLCVATCLRARAVGLPMPGAIATFSGSFDATRSGRSMETKASLDPIVTREGLAVTDSMYVGGHDLRDDLLSPALTAELTGFPPMLLQSGGDEVLLDDSVRLAERARDADTDVILDVVAGVPHTFQFLTNKLDEAEEALDRAAHFLARCLSRR